MNATLIAINGIEELFTNDITSGQATLETVRRIAAFGKQREYRMNPDILKTFTTLKLSEDVGEINPFAPAAKNNDEEPQTAKEKLRNKKQFIPKKEKKRLKKEREIEQQLTTATGAANKTLVMKTQREILRSVFATYFRVIKKAPLSPVLPTVLQGLAQYSHLISVDFLSDLINVLLQICSEEQKDHPYNQIQCCLAVFKTLKAHGDSLNILTYSILPFVTFSHERDCWLPLVNALSVMVASDRKAVALERVAAFAKRISTLALSSPPHLSIALLHVVRILLAKFPKVQQLLSSEYTYAAGTYNAIIDQPDHCGPFATSLWETSLLSLHFHPVLAQLATSITTCDPASFLDSKQNPMYRHMKDTSMSSPASAEYLYHMYDTAGGAFTPPIPPPHTHRFEKKLKDKRHMFVRLQNNTGTTTTQTTIAALEVKSALPPTAVFSKYFKAIRKFDSRKELFHLKQTLARHKVSKIRSTVACS